MSGSRRLTKAERERHIVEAQQQTLQLHRALATISRGISKSGNRELIDAWSWFVAFWQASIEKTVNFEDGAQRIRRVAATKQRAFTDEQYQEAAAKAKNDKDTARLLGVHPTTIARYKKKNS